MADRRSVLTLFPEGARAHGLPYYIRFLDQV